MISVSQYELSIHMQIMSISNTNTHIHTNKFVEKAIFSAHLCVHVSATQLLLLIDMTARDRTILLKR